MPRAVLRNGVIYPLDPLPPDWADGKELWLKETDEAVDRNASDRRSNSQTSIQFNAAC